VGKKKALSQVNIDEIMLATRVYRNNNIFPVEYIHEPIIGSLCMKTNPWFSLYPSFQHETSCLKILIHMLHLKVPSSFQS
jgi:hypothetical protein